MSKSVALLACLIAAAPPSSNKPKAPPRATARPLNLAGLVTANPLPPGLHGQVIENKEGNKLNGHAILVSKGEETSKVLIMVEARAIPSRAEKITAIKGYVNGTAQGLDAAGMKLVTKTLPPDIEKVDPDQRQIYILGYKTPAGGNLIVQLQIFFGKKGYHIQVIADNKDDFVKLAGWARTVKPAP